MLGIVYMTLASPFILLGTIKCKTGLDLADHIIHREVRNIAVSQLILPKAPANLWYFDTEVINNFHIQ